jgi:hypothetical protein
LLILQQRFYHRLLMFDLLLRLPFILLLERGGFHPRSIKVFYS